MIAVEKEEILQNLLTLCATR